MEQIIGYFTTNGMTWILIVIIGALGIHSMLKSQYFMKYMSKKQKYQNFKQQKQAQKEDNLSNKYFSLTQDLLQQNSKMLDFIREQIMKQFQSIRSRDDWTERYLEQIIVYDKQILNKTQQVILKLGKPFLTKQMAKKTLQITLQLLTKRVMCQIENDYQKIQDNREIIIDNLRKSIRQYLRQFMDYMNNFQTNFGQFGKIYKSLIQQTNFQKLIEQISDVIYPHRNKGQIMRMIQIVIQRHKSILIKQIYDLYK